MKIWVCEFPKFEVVHLSWHPGDQAGLDILKGSVELKLFGEKDTTEDAFMGLVQDMVEWADKRVCSTPAGLKLQEIARYLNGSVVATVEEENADASA